MHPRTLATLESLYEVKWFRNVGVQDSDSDSAIILSSWDEAIAHCSAPEWEDLCLEATNQYRELLLERSPADFAKWNDIVTAVKPISQALMREKTELVINRHALPKTFLDTVDWDILHLCMEAEYAEIYPPGFYAAQSYWYSAGISLAGGAGRFPTAAR